MARFQSIEAYHSTDKPIELLPFRFERTASGYLVSNMVGDFVRLSADEFSQIVDLRISPGDSLYEKAFASHLITRQGHVAQLQILAMRLRSRMAFLREPTALHMFVVTLRCEHSCPYCQVSRQSTDRTRFDMTESVAERALNIAMESPPSQIKIEFQGGEPLLNLPLIEKIVERAKIAAPKSGKKVQFVIASNLALLDDQFLAFCKRNDILLSTSLDGPADLHNRNRPRPGGNSYELAVKGIKAAQNALGADRVGALMTTTESSLDRVKEIIDEYVALGLGRYHRMALPLRRSSFKNTTLSAGSISTSGAFDTSSTSTSKDATSSSSILCFCCGACSRISRLDMWTLGALPVLAWAHWSITMMARSSLLTKGACWPKWGTTPLNSAMSIPQTTARSFCLRN
jgi:sulfatase maturation enzyme AslB (radical SAM superfamily)